MLNWWQKCFLHSCLADKTCQARHISKNLIFLVCLKYSSSCPPFHLPVKLTFIYFLFEFISPNLHSARYPATLYLSFLHLSLSLSQVFHWHSFNQEHGKSKVFPSIYEHLVQATWWQCCWFTSWDFSCFHIPSLHSGGNFHGKSPLQLTFALLKQNRKKDWWTQIRWIFNFNLLFK